MRASILAAPDGTNCKADVSSQDASGRQTEAAMNNDVNEIFEMLDSGDLLAQVAGLNDARELILELVQRSVRSLFNSPKENLHAIGDRLFAMGSVIVPELEKSLHTGGEPEAMTCAALILMQYGSHAGVAQLFQALKAGSEASPIIASYLASARIPGASEAITDALLRFPIFRDASAPYRAANLILALTTSLVRSITLSEAS